MAPLQVKSIHCTFRNVIVGVAAVWEEPILFVFCEDQFPLLCREQQRSVKT